MKKEEIRFHVENILRNVLEVPDLEVFDELSADNVPSWDSMRHLILINEVEKFFNLEFKLKELISLSNVGELISLIENKVS